MYTYITTILSRYKLLTASIAVIFIYSATLAYAAGGPFNPHDTLDPDCVPSAVTCYVVSGGGSSPWTVNGSDIYYTSGNVGIGTNTPATKLDIAGDFLNTFTHNDGSISSIENDDNLFNKGFPGVGLLTDDTANSGTLNFMFTHAGSTNLGTANGVNDVADIATHFAVTHPEIRLHIKDSALGSDINAKLSSLNGFVLSGRDSLASSQGFLIENNNNDNLLQVMNDGKVTIGKLSPYSSVPGTEETKMYFDPTNKAFRVGSVLGNEWDYTGPGGNVGPGSIAIGFAIPIYSIPGPVSSGYGSLALGAGSTASGLGSLAYGIGSISEGTGAVAFGNNSHTYDDGDIAIGGHTTASNGNGQSHDIAIGTNVTAINGNAVGIGGNINANGAQSVAIGNNLTTYGSETALGRFTTAYTPGFPNQPRLLIVGNGTDPNNAGALSDALTILDNGNTAIGINNWENSLTHPENTDIRFEVAGSGNGVGTIARFADTTNGTFCDIGPNYTGGIACSSDAILKKNIETINTSDTLTKFMQLNPVLYNWKKEADGTAKVDGFIAQDVQSLFPNLVQASANGTLTLSYTGFIPYTVAAIKELNTKVASMQPLLSTQGSISGQLADAVVHIKSIVFGTPEAPSGFTMYDTVTHTPYCVTLANGDFVKTQGECGATQPPQTLAPTSTLTPPTPIPIPTPQPQTPDPVPNDASVTPPSDQSVTPPPTTPTPDPAPQAPTDPTTQTQ